MENGKKTIPSHVSSFLSLPFLCVRVLAEAWYRNHFKVRNRDTLLSLVWKNCQIFNVSTIRNNKAKRGEGGA